jgi:hypothetical protein
VLPCDAGIFGPTPPIAGSSVARLTRFPGHHVTSPAGRIGNPSVPPLARQHGVRDRPVSWAVAHAHCLATARAVHQRRRAAAGDQRAIQSDRADLPAERRTRRWPHGCTTAPSTLACAGVCEPPPRDIGNILNEASRHQAVGDAPHAPAVPSGLVAL